jgi:hypothetical protein
MLMDSIWGWLAVGVGVFIIWRAWSGKSRVRGNSGQPVFFVPVPGAPARRSPFLTLLLVVALFIGLLTVGNWLLKVVPPLPPVR